MPDNTRIARYELCADRNAPYTDALRSGRQPSQLLGEKPVGETTPIGCRALGCQRHPVLHPARLPGVPGASGLGRRLRHAGRFPAAAVRDRCSGRTESGSGLRSCNGYSTSPPAHYFVLATDGLGAPWEFLAVDVSSDYRRDGRVFYQGEEILASRRLDRGFWVPSPALEFGCYLVKKVAKRSLREEHGRRLTELYHQDPAGCEREIARFWRRGSARLIGSVAASGEWDTVRELLPSPPEGALVAGYRTGVGIVRPVLGGGCAAAVPALASAHRRPRSLPGSRWVGQEHHPRRGR